MNEFTGRLALLVDACRVLDAAFTPFIGPLRPDDWEEWP